MSLDLTDLELCTSVPLYLAKNVAVSLRILALYLCTSASRQDVLKILKILSQMLKNRALYLCICVPGQK